MGEIRQGLYFYEGEAGIFFNSATRTRQDMAKTLTFEKRLERIKEIVALLEADDLPLERGVQLFQEGVRLSRECGVELEQARLIVERAGQGDSSWEDA